MDKLCFYLPGHSDAALRNMNNLREQLHFCDVTIVAGGRQMFRGHKVVLAAGSAFLRDQFLLNPSAELQVSVLHSSTVIRELLQSCYTGILQFSAKEIVNYLTAASYLQMEHVVEKCRGALSQYLKPKSNSLLNFVKEESQSISVIINGGLLEPISPKSDHGSPLQPHSSGEEPQSENMSLSKLQPSEHSVTEEDDDETEKTDYGMYAPQIKSDHSDLENESIREEVTGGEELSREDVTATGSNLRGNGVRIWKRRFGDPRASRGRGFKHKKRSMFRERRPLGFQQAWRFPTSEEIMGSFANLGQDLLALEEGSLRVDFQPSECQADAPSSDVEHGHFGMEGSRTEDSVSMVPLGTNQESKAEDSVDVVGSTSCVTGTVACEQCGLAFSSVHDLVVHSHSTHLLYICPCCGKHFSNISNLNRHMAVHRSAKVHSCPICHKNFTQKSTLIDHMNMHSGERPHICAFCHVCFAHKPALRRHLKEQHGKTTAQNYVEIQKEAERGPVIGAGVDV